MREVSRRNQAVPEGDDVGERKRASERGTESFAGVFANRESNIRHVWCEMVTPRAWNLCPRPPVHDAMWDIALRVTREYQPVASLYMRFCLCPVFSSGRGLLNPPGRFMYCLALRVVFLFTALTLAFGSSTCCPDVDPKPAKPIIAIISGSNPPNPSSCSSAGGGGGGGGTSRGGGGGTSRGVAAPTLVPLRRRWRNLPFERTEKRLRLPRARRPRPLSAVYLYYRFGFCFHPFAIARLCPYRRGRRGGGVRPISASVAAPVATVAIDRSAELVVLGRAPAVASHDDARTRRCGGGVSRGFGGGCGGRGVAGLE